MSKRVKSEYDLVIVGSGIAGLSFALKVAEAGYRVAIFTKKIRRNRIQIMLRVASLRLPLPKMI